MTCTWGCLHTWRRLQKQLEINGFARLLTFCILTVKGLCDHSRVPMLSAA